MTRRTLKKPILIATVAWALLSYVGTYLWRSMRGRYEPVSIGLNGVKQYHWAPSGFVTEFRWNQAIMVTYFPLHRLDLHFWHTASDAYSQQYPVNRVAPEDIEKVYRAWQK